MNSVYNKVAIRRLNIQINKSINDSVFILIRNNISIPIIRKRILLMITRTIDEHNN